MAAIDIKTTIQSRSDEIDYLVDNEDFTRQEAIKLILTLDWIEGYAPTP